MALEMPQDSTSLKTVFSIFEESAGAGIIDVLQMMSRKGYLGEAYDGRQSEVSAS